jgi:hypothetical protein
MEWGYPHALLHRTFLPWLEPGFKQDLVRANNLLKIAADLGDTEAKAVLSSIKSQSIEICSDHIEQPSPNRFAGSDTSRQDQKAETQMLRACD